MQRGKGRFAVLAVAAIFILAGCSGSSMSNGGGEPSSTTSSTTPSAVTIYPGSPTVSLNQTINFTAYLPSAPNSTFTWSVTGGGAINSSTGVYTAPATVPSSAVTVTATSTSSSTATGAATINVVSPPGVSVSPAALAIKAGAVQVFSATPAATTWLVHGTPGGDSVYGTISSNGTYVAPPVPPPGGSATITAVAGTASGTATATVVFSRNSLNGSYAYSYTGDNSSGYLAVAGSFTAQGSGNTGNIVNGLEEVVSPGSAAQGQFTGTFSVNPDGSATATLSNGEVWQLALVSNQSGTAAQQSPLIRFDKNATGSGTIDLQNPVFLSTSAFSGNYVFGVSGPDPNGKPLAMAGRFFSDGVGTIIANAAEEDINYNGTNTFATADASLQGSFAADPVHGNINGNGTVTFTTTDSSIFGTTTTTSSTSTTTTSFQFEYFIVDNTHIKVVEIDKNFALAGDFYSAANMPSIGAFTAGKTLPAGKYAFTLGGQSTTGAYALGGVMTSNGSNSTTGSITNGVIDINNGAFDVQLDNTLTGSSFTVDANLGRISLPLTVKSQTINVALYGAAYNTANGPVELFEMIELDNNVASGLAVPQTSLTPLSGNYAFNFAGVANAGGNAVKQDFVGQFATTGNALFQGSLNINNFGQSSLLPGVPLTANSTIIAPDANGRGTLTINSASATFPLAYYISDNGALLLETDLARVATGSLTKQF
jgi:hypothetical protein